MRVYGLSDCRAAVTWEQQVRCSPANGNAGSDFTTRNWFADGSTHRRKGILPTFCKGIASAAGVFPPMAYGNTAHLLNGIKTETEHIFSPHPTAEKEKTLIQPKFLHRG